MVSTLDQGQRSFGMSTGSCRRNVASEINLSSAEDLCDSGRGSLDGSLCSTEIEEAIEAMRSAVSLSNESAPSPSRDHCTLEERDFSFSSDDYDEADCPTPKADYPGLSFSLWETARNRRFGELEQLLIEVCTRRSSRSHTPTSSASVAAKTKRKSRRVRFADQAVYDVLARSDGIGEECMSDTSDKCSPLAASVDYRNIRGVTPLHLCAFAGELSCVRLLLTLGADPNAADGDGWTPVHAACAAGHAEVVIQLATSGAAMRLKDADGRRPKHVARDQKTKDVVRWLSRITRKSVRSTLV